jgi:periplasmic copper chaperone A
MFGKLLAAGIVSLLLAGTAVAQTGHIEVRNAWARATPEKAETGAAYLTVEAPAADRLTGIDTPVATKAELHTMSMDGNVMKMRALDGVDLPAGQPVALRPGATHIMLLGLKAPLQSGQSFPLTLHFAKGGTQQVNVAVEKMGASGPPQSPGGGMAMPMPASR